ncbi:hypothetical protein PHYSODRAFT_313622 [Phytophthora sojae]|uniref:Uncharacterized protein n=1 Tax=Phytophthora sojae (strain P6497) TaxID=1094619 RepID=G4Z2K3_PHYSP|nr:hypothetical protein PHYSODRAFT_313622 [Phytophthora sojae]EGZ21432.1 hypothetical protein PHYSODRAFT_313622 [Phytophthora sojae]|eukprot:XP_009524149.1 hypothetical protein PHYSODRAFT_313622 [Phytophthora sojae]
MRKDGVPVSTIAKDVDRSTNYIYRILKRFSTQQQSQQQQEANVTTTNTPATPATATATPRSVAAPVQQPQQAQAPSDALLCAVESMEVSAYESIPMLKSVGNSTQAPAELQPGTVNASVAFTSNASKPQSDDTPDFWLLSDPEPSRAPVQPSKKQKTPSSASVPASSALTVTRQSQRSPESSSMTIQDPDSAGLGELLKRVQDEIRRLEHRSQGDVYDAQLLQTLVKFHAEMLLLQLQKTQFTTATRQAADEAAETSRLLRERLGKEIALLNVQADRERLELEREQIKHKATTLLCRKRLLDANASPIDVDQLFPRQ